MKQEEVTRLIMEVLNGKGKHTPQEIHNLFRAEVPIIQMHKALKKLTDEDLVTVEHIGAERFYQVNKSTYSAKAVSTRDLTKYSFNGKKGLSKGRLALEIVKKYVEKNPVTMAELEEVFRPELIKPYGIFQLKEKAKELSGDRKRFFMADDECIQLTDAVVCVTNQFTTDRIQTLITLATTELKFKITAER